VLPIERLIAELSRRGVEVLVDGAHAPRMVLLELRALGATCYSGNCHKWLCAPKGAGFLWVRRDRRADIHPLTISHGASAHRPGRERFRHEFDWTGTGDPTTWLTVPRAIEYVGGLLPGGWPAVMARNRALALEARRLLCDAVGAAAPCPETRTAYLLAAVLVAVLLGVHTRRFSVYPSAKARPEGCSHGSSPPAAREPGAPLRCPVDRAPRPADTAATSPM
jgi:isopenicillin-N epimerase